MTNETYGSLTVGDEWRRTTGRPVDVGGRGADTLGILDIEVGFDTGIALVVQTAIDLDSAKSTTNSVCAVLLEEGLQIGLVGVFV